MLFSAPLYIEERHCGYCNDSKTDYFALESKAKLLKDKPHKETSTKKSITLGTSIIEMTCQEYDSLINSGFRRSGDFLYKPDLLRTCCRLYTIRTNKSYLEISKKQRKSINKFIKEICPDEKLLDPIPKNSFNLNRLFEAQLKSKNFKVKFEPSKFSKEKYQLYKKYQISVHNDDPQDVSEVGFRRFLCDAPFPKNEIEGEKEDWVDLDIHNWSKEKPKRIGPTHVCYYLNDKLIAISILDFLPSGISSIYFIWDTDFAHLSLGVISSINEIVMCEKLGFDWYYLGYYVEDCVKMNYKANFGGEILDVCNETYYPMKDIKPFLQNGRLFVIGDEDQRGELNCEVNGNVQSKKLNDEVNVSELIYGSPETEVEAKKIAHIISKKYGIKGNNFYKIPNVMPGLIPLWKIKMWLDEGKISNSYSQNISLSGNDMEYRFDELNSQGKSIIIDSIRVFGLERVKNSTIVI
ncbi:ATE1 [Candida pseudojiufengensis]|uniref:ATE1 n=1 Tax=Candida pseudojiufengensis TaxID=497109 RepID=UPI00222526E8|nr:ATE1 [Candida pseudojiufengensis]KAI5960611.1 ATE1 [Candida pseudojiufengensis]